MNKEWLVPAVALVLMPAARAVVDPFPAKGPPPRVGQLAVVDGQRITLRENRQVPVMKDIPETRVINVNGRVMPVTNIRRVIEYRQVWVERNLAGAEIQDLEGRKIDPGKLPAWVRSG